MRRFAYVLLLSAMFLLESTITTVPLVLVTLIILYVIKKDTALFPLAFIFGLILDIALVYPIGHRSLFFTLFLFIIFSYERKFETKTLQFIFFAVALGAVCYLLINDLRSNPLFYGISAGFLAVIVFTLLQRLRLTTSE